MRPGKQQRAILDILQDGEENGDVWTDGELYNDAGMWSVSSRSSDGMRYGRRCQADPARRLFEQGYVMYKETRARMGLHNADRVVYCLTEKGKRA